MGVLNRIGDVVLMARLAGYGQVFILQLEGSFGVVEIRNALYSMKGFIAVAAGTVRTELVVVGVGMTIGAALKLQPGELLKFLPVAGSDLMTGEAGYRLMLSGKLVLCQGVTELCGRFEGQGIMALGTIFGQAFLVIIGMATNARGGQPEIGEFFTTDCFAADKFRLMTVGTSFFCMHTRKTKPGKVMVELLF